MSRSLKQFGIYVIVIAVAFPLVFLLSEAVSQNRVALAESYEDSELDLQGSRMTGFALGAEGLLADWYWMRSLQYIGDKLVKSELEAIDIEDLRPLNPRLLYPLLENATDLDPKFMAAYSYGAVVLPAIDPNLAVKLTEKGIANNPESWRLYQYLGYIHWRNKNYERAAETYSKGSMIAGAPPFMRAMAASMKTRGGSRETARQIYSQILAEAGDPQSKQNAEMRLMELDSLDEREAVNAALSEFLTRTGQCVSKISDVFPNLRGVRLPNNRQFLINEQNELADPSGTPYRLNTERCTVELNENSKIPKQ